MKDYIQVENMRRRKQEEYNQKRKQFTIELFANMAVGCFFGLLLLAWAGWL